MWCHRPGKQGAASQPALKGDRRLSWTLQHPLVESHWWLSWWEFKSNSVNQMDSEMQKKESVTEWEKRKTVALVMRSLRCPLGHAAPLGAGGPAGSAQPTPGRVRTTADSIILTESYTTCCKGIGTHTDEKWDGKKHEENCVSHSSWRIFGWTDVSVKVCLMGLRSVSWMSSTPSSSEHNMELALCPGKRLHWNGWAVFFKVLPQGWKDNDV